MPVDQAMDLHAVSNAAVTVPLLVLGAVVALLVFGLAVLHLLSRLSLQRRARRSGLRFEWWRPGHTLAIECEAFLDGSYVPHEQPRSSGDCLTWLSHLAHTDLEHLRARAAVSGQRAIEQLDTWGGAVSLLAKEILRYCDSLADLRHVQRTVLVPLELDLLNRGEPRPGPEGLTRLILARLERQPRHHR